MTERSSPSADRLDSWKAIADYLGRDIATVRRWERLKGLPVRRIGQGRGHSVFAYASEIDAWLRASPPTEAPTIAAAPDLSPAPPAPARSTSGWRWPLMATVLLVASGLFWRMPLLPAERTPVRAEMRDTGLVTFDSSGHLLWQYEFSTDDQATKWAAYADVQFLSGAAPGVLAATAYRERAGDKRIRGGELLWWTPKGALAQRFSFDDVVSFGDAKFGEPWVISDFRVHEQGSRRRIAVAARHDHWWPALVTVLDEQWKRGATFVNSGWVNQVQWLSQDRLAISGYSNALDGGMVAILDLPALNGQSPTAADSRYRCTTCGSGSPARYAVLPRTEVNQASASPLNGATVRVQDGRILVRTIELPRTAEAVEAIYEFSPSLDLLSASYGDRYWEAHRALEAEGKIRHTRERCPYRDGPPGIKIWDPASQWRTGPAGILPPK